MSFNKTKKSTIANLHIKTTTGGIALCMHMSQTASVTFYTYDYIWPDIEGTCFLASSGPLNQICIGEDLLDV